MITVKYGYEVVANLKNVEMIEGLLKKLVPEKNEDNLAYHFIHDNKNQLIIGLSNNLCHVQFTDRKLKVYIPRANLTYDDELIVFSLGGHYSEISRRHCVPFNQVVKITEVFFETGRLPANIIDWVVFGN